MAWLRSVAVCAVVPGRRPALPCVAPTACTASRWRAAPAGWQARCCAPVVVFTSAVPLQLQVPGLVGVGCAVAKVVLKCRAPQRGGVPKRVAQHVVCHLTAATGGQAWSGVAAAAPGRALGAVRAAATTKQKLGQHQEQDAAARGASHQGGVLGATGQELVDGRPEA